MKEQNIGTGVSEVGDSWRMSHDIRPRIRRFVEVPESEVKSLGII